jgi:hypothetical protein
MRGRLAPVLLALGVASLVSSCDALAPAGAGIRIEGLELEPREVRGALAEQPVGPLVELMRGEVAGVLVKMTAQAGADSFCVAAYRGSDGIQHCGVMPADGAATAGPFLTTFVADPEADVMQVGGVADDAVRSVVATFVDGRRAEALMLPLDVAGFADHSAFILYLPPGAPHSLVAYGAGDEELERLEFQPAP